MNICYLINNEKKYIDILRVSIVSVLEHNTKYIKFYILYDGLVENDKESLRRIINNSNAEIYFIDVSLHTNDISLHTNWPNIVNVRLFLHEHLPDDVEKILYLDSDTLIVGPLGNLYDTDISSKAIAVAADTVRNEFKEQIGLKKSDIYFNSGVILINVKRYSQLLNKTTINRMIEEYGRNIIYPDQDLLNCCFVPKSEYSLLPLKYNMLPPYFLFDYQKLIQYKGINGWIYKENEYSYSINNPVIIHFAGSFCYSRPWVKKCRHPYAGQYREISYRINGGRCIYTDDRNFRQRIEAFCFRRIPEDIIVPLVCWVKRLYEKRK